MPAEKHILDQTVGDVLNTVVSTPARVRSGDRLKAAIDAMIDVPITRKVYVMDDDDTLVGTISVPTLLRQVGYRLGVRSTGIASLFRYISEVLREQVDDFMDPPITVTADTSLVEATRLMVENRLNDLPVVDDDGHLVGELNSFEILMKARDLFDDGDGR
ncbi:MAG TPA: CBS domain-containing protein [Thermoplasmata archaeon]|nr:CBS domain-containing protein [Thermoplasmata archaeon]